MKRPVQLLLCIFLVPAALGQGPPAHLAEGQPDWLLGQGEWKARVVEDGERLVLTNGLVERVFRGGTTVALNDLMTGTSLLRAVEPEALVDITSTRYSVGEVQGQPDRAYLTEEWESALSSPGILELRSVEQGELVAPFEWKRVRRAEDRAWPPAGLRLTFTYGSTRDMIDGARDPMVRIHHELYDGLPCVGKWIEVTGHNETILLERVVSERLAFVEAESRVDTSGGHRLPNVTAITDMAFGGMSFAGSNKAIRWLPDPDYGTQVNYNKLTPALLEASPPTGPGVTLAPGETFRSPRSFVLVHDSTERERQGLAVRRFFRTLAPWVTENPIQMHVRSADPEAVRLAIDQAADVGFEMVILTFGSGFNMEDERPEVLARWKALADYAHEKGIELGGYSLLSSRSIGPETDVIDRETGKPGGARFGNAPCLGSEWGIEYFAKLRRFFEATGFDLLEHDGSYPGDSCASTTHPGHVGWDDSQWRQWETIRDFYGWCQANGVYLNVPDFYFLAGSNKVGMGYRETNWSLPRAQQIVHARQNVFDGTWEKTPSMGWMFVPLTQYHGGGEAAVLEPLSEHLDDYEAHLANLFGAGVQAAYRGPRLYDTAETRAVVKRWVDFFLAHRDILESDVLHLARANGRDLDALLHVNAALEERGLLVVHNPLDRDVERELVLPLYYTGLTDVARVSERGGEARELTLDRHYTIRLTVRVPARGNTWFVIQ